MVHIKISGDGDDDDVTFSLPKQYVSAVPPYFEKAFDGRFKEGETGQICLDDVALSTLKTFVEWLISSRLVHPHCMEYKDYVDMEEQERPDLIKRNLVDINVFSDKYDVPQLRRDTLKVFIDLGEKSGLLPSFSLIADIYERLPSKSPMIAYPVDAYVYHWSGNGCSEEEAEEVVPKAFLLAYARKMARVQMPSAKPVDPYSSDCQYHEHDDQQGKKA